MTVKAAIEGMGIITLAMSFGDACKVRMHVDASAALGVIQRKGMGKLRHLRIGASWIKEKQIRNVIPFQEIPGTLNPAELLTRYLSREAIDKYSEMLRAINTEGRSDKAAPLHQLQRKVRQLRSQVKARALKSLDTIVPVCAPDMDEERFVFEHVGQVSFKINAIIDDNSDEWKKHQCRRERVSRKSLSWTRA